MAFSGESSADHVNKEVNEDHEILTKFKEFKKFDIVQDPSDHHYVHKRTSTNQPSRSWSKKIQEEWKILEKDLPDTILVRAYESRMDLMRAVIVGAEKTPYHDGLFFFDVFFPESYPNDSPVWLWLCYLIDLHLANQNVAGIGLITYNNFFQKVYNHSRGVQLNPNLNDNGKVCLSLLNTWFGDQTESWIPNLSTMLQVLVSLQGLVLNAKPYFNHNYLLEASGTNLTPDELSLRYNEHTFILSLKTMVCTLQQQPKHFEDFVVGHFFTRAKDILVACKAYMEGAQVGSLVDGIQDLDEGDKSCTWFFKESLNQYMNVLMDAFTSVGVKDCQQFIPVRYV